VGGGVSKDRYLTCKVRGLKAGDPVTLTAEDNLGETGAARAIAS
jgi:hypothetical protein